MFLQNSNITTTTNLTTTNLTTTKMSSAIYVNDLNENDVCVPFPVILLMYAFVSASHDLPKTFEKTLTNMGKDEKMIKHVLMIEKLFASKDTWISNDEDLMAFFVGLILLIYKREDRMDGMMHELCERYLEDTTLEKITEHDYKLRVDTIMALRNVTKILNDFDLSVEPQGSWYEYDGKKFLKLTYLKKFEIKNCKKI